MYVYLSFYSVSLNGINNTVESVVFYGHTSVVNGLPEKVKEIVRAQHGYIDNDTYTCLWGCLFVLVRGDINNEMLLIKTLCSTLLEAGHVIVYDVKLSQYVLFEIW